MGALLAEWILHAVAAVVGEGVLAAARTVRKPARPSRSFLHDERLSLAQLPWVLAGGLLVGAALVLASRHVG